MPEERGLYQDVRLKRCLLYLASLSDVPVNEARRRLTRYLARFDLTEHKNMKVKELSKGMQQKAQIIATLLALQHDVRPEDVLYQLTDQRIHLERFEVAVPSLDEIFIRVVEEGRKAA